MNRIALPDPSHAGEKSRQLFTAIQGKFGSIPNVFRMLGNSSAALKGYLDFNTDLSGGLLPAKLREQVALAVSEINGCDYCLSAHSFFGGKTGLKQGDIDAARQAKAGDDRTAAALEFAKTVTNKRGKVGDAELAKIRTAGFTDGEIIEIVSHVALTTLTNYVNTVANTEIDFPIVKTGEFKMIQVNS